MDNNLSIEGRVMKLEQQRGIAYSINLIEGLIGTMEEEIAYRAEQKETTEEE